MVKKTLLVGVCSMGNLTCCGTFEEESEVCIEGDPEVELPSFRNLENKDFQPATRAAIETRPNDPVAFFQVQKVPNVANTFSTVPRQTCGMKAGIFQVQPVQQVPEESFTLDDFFEASCEDNNMESAVPEVPPSCMSILWGLPPRTRKLLEKQGELLDRLGIPHSDMTPLIGWQKMCSAEEWERIQDGDKYLPIGIEDFSVEERFREVMQSRAQRIRWQNGP
eukprot:s649_g35.t1